MKLGFLKKGGEREGSGKGMGDKEAGG